MFLFWTLAALMTAAALAFVLVPLLRAREVAGPTAQEAALEVLRGQRREIEVDIAAGNLPPEAREEALAELVERADDDLAGATSAKAPPAGTRRPWLAAASLAVMVPALAFGLYAAIGTPSALDAKALAAPAHPVKDQAQMVAMIETLAAKMRERPDDAQGWSLLARSMAALGRFSESAAAYEQLARLVPGDAQVLSDWADALGMAQGRTLNGRPEELARRALEIDPKHPKALALSATAALERQDFPAAIGLWERMRAVLDPASPDAAQITTILEDVRARAAAAGRPVAVAKAAPPAPGPTPAAGAPGSLTGSVTIAPAISSRLTGEETLFVFARAAEGPRVPLALVRANARALPLQFALDDSQAMSPDMKLSSAQAVRIEARISRTGNATPQSGDLVGTSAVVKPGARGVNVVVDKVVP